MTSTVAATVGTPKIVDFARHMRFSSPFESNRVSDAVREWPPDVPAIHKAEFEELNYLVDQAHGRSGVGVMLWGEPGVGKSHLLARVLHDLRDRACVSFLHNVQAGPDRLPRYVLKCVLGQLARSPNESLRDGPLNELLVAAVKKAHGQSVAVRMADARAALRHALVTPAGPVDQEMVYECLFSYFHAISRAWRQSGDANPIAAETALRWLGGDSLDADEVDLVGLSNEFRRRPESKLPDDQAVEAVLAALARLAAFSGRTFVLLFDQVDNLGQEQVSAWARFAHALIDHVPNLLVVTSGVKGRIVELREDSTMLNSASWDRIAQRRIEIGRISPQEARDLLEARLTTFLKPFLDLPEVTERVCRDGLFPLGSAWLEDRLDDAVDVRPRDVINWAQDRFRDMAGEIARTTPDAWLAAWPGNRIAADPRDVPLTSSEREQRVDKKVDNKLAEQRRFRQLNPDSLPADSGNLMGLVERLLGLCLDPRDGYSLRHVSRPERSSADREPLYDLLVTERTPDEETVETGIKFIATGSKNSAAATLRRLVADERPPRHVLLVTEERCPLRLGPKGAEYLSLLESRGDATFGHRELDFDEHVELDALQSVVGQARSGDLELAVPGGLSEPIDAAEVARSHHRNDRFRRHVLLRELLTEEPCRSADESRRNSSSKQPENDDHELFPFIMSQVALTSGVSTAELADKYSADHELDPTGIRQVRERIERAVATLHRDGKLAVTPQDDFSFVSLAGPLTGDRGEFERRDGEPITPVHFSVSQVRQAAACARLLHFDAKYTREQKLKHPRVTRIWQENGDASDVGALGTLFHQSVEQFNDSAIRSREVRRLLESPGSEPLFARALHELVFKRHVDMKRFSGASATQRSGFEKALARYCAELAQMLSAGLARHATVDEVLDQMFGDRRRNVDVTFEVGPNGRKVHVTGRLDYLFYDWRREGHRIIDYKLTPSTSMEADLYQVCVYALMHHQQHGTEPDVALLYLHPERRMKETPWSDVFARRHEIYDLLASMVDWRNYQPDPRIGAHPPGNPIYCGRCRYSEECRSALGEVEKGEWSSHWTELAAAGSAPAEPVVQRRDTTDGPQESMSQSLESKSGGELKRPARPNRASRTDRSDADPRKPGEPATADVDKPNPSPSHHSNDALMLGTCDGGDCVELPVRKLETHVALVGAAGSGKTWMAKVVAEEAVRQGVPIIAIDPQGDLVQFLRRAGSLPDRYSSVGDEYWQRVEPRVFTPGSSHAARLCLDPMRVPRLADLQDIDVEARRGEEREALLSAIVTNIVGLANAGGDADLQRTFLMQLVRALTERRSDAENSSLQLRDLVAAVMAPDDLGMDDPDLYIPKSQREKLGRKLRSLLDGPSAKLFRGGQALDIDAFCRPNIQGKTPLNVIYLNALTSDSEKQFFVAALATEIYRWMVSTRKETGRPRLLVYLDEARDFIPAGSTMPPPKMPLIRLFAQGRKFGVCGMICTQSPRSVDYNVFGNCSTKLIGRLESAHDVNRVAEWFSTDGGRPDWLSARKSARPGTFVARWPEMPSAIAGRPFKGRSLFSLHEGAWSPDRVEREVAEDRRAE